MDFISEQHKQELLEACAECVTSCKVCTIEIPVILPNLFPDGKMYCSEACYEHNQRRVLH